MSLCMYEEGRGQDHLTLSIYVVQSNQSSPTSSNNNITCVSDYFQKQLDMLSPYQLENLTSLVNGDLVLLERKYRAIPNLEVWESLIGLCILNCYDDMVRDLGGISYEDRLTTNDSSPSSLASEELTTATIQIHRDQTLRRSEILQRSAIPDQTLRSAILDCFQRECDAMSRLHQTLYLRIDGRQKNTGLLPSSRDDC